MQTEHETMDMYMNACKVCSSLHDNVYAVLLGAYLLPSKLAKASRLACIAAAEQRCMPWWSD